MAGGDAGDSRDLDQTPTWAVAAVSSVFILISLLLEKGLHHLGEWLTKKHKKTLFDALEKVKAELMILGFISLLLTVGETYITKICIPYKVAETMLPCPPNDTLTSEAGGGNHRRLLMDQNAKRRILAAGSPASCPMGKVPLISVNGLHQLHIFIFFLAVLHVANSALIMALGRAKIHAWKEWEKETQSVDYAFSSDPSRFRFADEITFVKRHASFWNRITILLYVVSFFNQFLRSVSKVDYLTMRHGFISVHLAPGTKFNFKRYIKRAMEDDFKVVVGVSPILWASAVIVLLLNVHGWQELFWASMVPLVIILAVGMKLQAIISMMANEIRERHTVVQGIPLVHLSDQHFWFGHPRYVLFLLHLALFQNAFQITYFFWIWYEFGLKSCFHNEFKFIIARIIIGVGGQILCSYFTLPLYALVSQMGSHLKRSIFDEHTSKALKRWHQGVKKKLKETSQSGSRTPSPGVSPRASLNVSPVHSMHRYRSIGHMGEAHYRSPRRGASDHGNSGGEVEISSSSEINQGAGPTEQQLHVKEGQDQENFSFSFAQLPAQSGQQSE
ncbi:MLO-like protein 9 isoform X1 [Musa acuminata AAA Group]|uniref:MLO-like protein 9 isoform X1 n=1 Tax=Musa acuminata AAA Group TaxID=214697 RepID=UPI0031D99C7C